MSSCSTKLKPQPCDVDPTSGNPRYWSKVTDRCECVYQVAPLGQQFNIDSCDFEIIPQDCDDDQYYWDNDQGMCVCYEETCEEGLTWDSSVCRCICDGEPEEGCPGDLMFDDDCCCCEVCEV